MEIFKTIKLQPKTSKRLCSCCIPRISNILPINKNLLITNICVFSDLSAERIDQDRRVSNDTCLFERYQEPIQLEDPRLLGI